MVRSLSLPLFLRLLLLLSGAGGVRLGGGGYEEWRLGTATYVKEFQPHPLNDGMRPLAFSESIVYNRSSSRDVESGWEKNPQCQLVSCSSSLSPSAVLTFLAFL